MADSVVCVRSRRANCGSNTRGVGLCSVIKQGCEMTAYYKDPKFFQQDSNSAFDVLHRPGTPAPFSGIYRCAKCGKTDVSTLGNPLPPQNHHQHNPPAPIQWQLIVATAN